MARRLPLRRGRRTGCFHWPTQRSSSSLGLTRGSSAVDAASSSRQARPTEPVGATRQVIANGSPFYGVSLRSVRLLRGRRWWAGVAGGRVHYRMGWFGLGGVTRRVLASGSPLRGVGHRPVRLLRGRRRAATAPHPSGPISTWFPQTHPSSMVILGLDPRILRCGRRTQASAGGPTRPVEHLHRERTLPSDGRNTLERTGGRGSVRAANRHQGPSSPNWGRRSRSMRRQRPRSRNALSSPRSGIWDVLPGGMCRGRPGLKSWVAP